MSGYPKKDHSNEQQQRPAADGGDVMSLLRQMQQQLGYLEKKLDTLINQRPSAGGPPQDRPFRKPFQKPYRPWDKDRSSPGHQDRPGGGRPHGDRPFKKPFFKRRDR